MNENPSKRVLAKKVLFLYPHSVIQDQLMTILVQAEYEVGLLTDYKKASSLLYRFPSSILFINIEAEMSEPEWEQFITNIVQTRAKHDARVGILSYNPNPDLARKYLIDIGVQCGYIGLKLGLAESAKIILKTLEVNEARGDRKYVRVKCPSGKTGININLNGRIVSGKLLDLSSAGLSCSLPEDLNPKFVIDDMQLVLWGSLVKVRGKVIGHRVQEGEGKIHVLLFDEDIERETKARIYSFIRKVLQSELDGAG